MIGGSMNEAIRMQLSAFVDGELPDNEKELLLRRLSQDEDLRRELARHLAIGRAMRGELQLAGVDLLSDRISAAIESGDDLELGDEESGGRDRRIRPLAGFAIAATVALVAIFGLQQLNSGGVVDTPTDQITADNGITEPPVDELLQQLRLHHDANGPENNINTVLTSIEIGREAIEDQEDVAADDSGASDASDPEADGEPAEEPAEE